MLLQVNELQKIQKVHDWRIIRGRLILIQRIFSIRIHQIFSLLCDWSKLVTWPNIPQLKLGNIREYSPIFKKDLKDNKDKSLHVGRKYARIFVLGHYLFLVAQSFPRALLLENSSLLGTDNVCGQISEDIFVPSGDYCLIYNPKGLWF